jgi:hypothetical protein
LRARSAAWNRPARRQASPRLVGPPAWSLSLEAFRLGIRPEKERLRRGWRSGWDHRVGRGSGRRGCHRPRGPSGRSDRGRLRGRGHGCAGRAGRSARTPPRRSRLRRRCRRCRPRSTIRVRLRADFDPERAVCLCWPARRGLHCWSPQGSRRTSWRKLSGGQQGRRGHRSGNPTIGRPRLGTLEHGPD